MDGDAKRLGLKIGGAAVALVVFALGMHFGCNGDADVQKSRALARAGCTAAGQDPTLPKSSFVQCSDRAMKECATGEDQARRACAERIGKELMAPTTR